ncbi:hypothetical protein FHW96_002282 [Novosphingobium sp. SG751A]|uniref:hypothetical protein n=1 Tax=Novosphingobium sp. SG751A TaxID=2587000 RepID=UPI00155443FD|nr:hypothetical protein [Novosphingobium sp. SG751A]NOW46124.1 hypothetical protein [Novosphingobium sp. SG751A]
MRKDVANLLAKLGKREFHYQEFADRFSDVELWPLFETLIHDPRILNAPPAEDNAEAAVTANAAPAPSPAATATLAAITPARPESETSGGEATPASKDLSNLFARYGGQNAEDAPGDVHALLQKLAQQIEQGKL